MSMLANDNPQALMNEARNLLKAGQQDRAAEVLKVVLRANPNLPEAHFMMGSIYAGKGLVDPSTEHMEKARKLAPRNPHILDALGVLYDRQKRHEEAVETYEQILAGNPEGRGFIEATLRHGVALAKLKRYEEAAEDFRKVLKVAPNYAAAWHNLGNTLAKTTSREEAVAAFEKALSLDPGNAHIEYSLGRSLLWVGRYDEAITRLRTALRNAPHEVQILSYLILALRHAERHDEADMLEGLDDMILPVELPVPPGFGSLEEWNEALRDEIVNHPALTTEFTGRATQNGAKVDHMFAKCKTPLFELFETATRQAFEETLTRMPVKEGHPLPLAVPNGYRQNMWANVMYRGGHQIPHNHPKGWFSACYYNVLPDRVEDSGDAKEGWIEFGGTAYEFPAPKHTPLRMIKPELGLMLVFPSYVFHRTVPFESDQIRISCAFDALPNGWRR